jgi:hypothetical protein
MQKLAPLDFAAVIRKYDYETVAQFDITYARRWHLFVASFPAFHAKLKNNHLMIRREVFK